MKAELTSLWTSRRLSENQVCESVTLNLASQVATATLAVDQTHPFFFDHKLDHVPGLLLAEGMHQLAEKLVHQCLEGSRYRTCELHIEFERFCHFLTPVVLVAEAVSIRGDLATIRVRSEQAGEIRNLSEFVFEALSEQDKALDMPEESVAGMGPPCPKETINKVNPVNVMISRPETKNEALHAKILHPSPYNRLADHTDNVYHPLYILEAFMQTQRYLNHCEAKAKENKRIRDILRSLDVVLKRNVHRTEELGISVSRESRKVQDRGVSERVRKARVFTKNDAIGDVCIRTLSFETKRKVLQTA